MPGRQRRAGRRPRSRGPRSRSTTSRRGRRSPDVVAGLVRPGDLVLTVGAGDVTMVGPEMLPALAAVTRGRSRRWAGGPGGAPAPGPADDRQRRRRPARRRPAAGRRASRSPGVASSRSRFAARAAAVAAPSVAAGGLGPRGRRRPRRGLLAGRVQPGPGGPTVAGRGRPRRRCRRHPCAGADVPVGTPLARLDTDAIARRVIDSGTLAEVSVSRSWPRTVVIPASLRQPVLAFTNPQGQVTGCGQGRASSTPPVGVAAARACPVITAAARRRPAADAAARRDLGAGRHCPRPQRRDGHATSGVSAANLVTLKLGRVTVVWGGASEPQLKVEVMTVLPEPERASDRRRRAPPDALSRLITRADTPAAPMLNLPHGTALASCRRHELT